MSNSPDAEAKKALGRLQKAIQGDTSQVSTQVFLHADVTARNGAKYRYIKMDQDLATEFQSNVFLAVAGILYEILQGTGVLYPFSFEALEDGNLFYLPISDSDIMDSWVQQIPPDTANDMFDVEDEKYVDKLKFYFVSLKPLSELRLLTFRQKAGSQTIKKSRILAKLVSGNYTHLEDNILEFDKTVDFFIWENWVFIKSTNNFENITKYRKVANQLAEDGIIQIQQFLPGPLQTVVTEKISSNYAFTKKMANIQKSGCLQGLTINKVCEQIERHQLTVFTVTGDGDGRTISFDHNQPKQVWEFLHLIADSHYASPMTDRRYTALTKRERN